jgi:hypothetical protein
MAQSVAISGGSLSNFPVTNQLLRGKGGKSALWKPRIAPLQGHATIPSFSATSAAVFFRARRFGVVFLYLLNPFNSGRFANRVNQRKQRDDSLIDSILNLF